MLPPASTATVLSAIQPTSGDLHFGNYFGAVKNWVKLQDDYRCIYGVVNYHSMTVPYQAKVLRENTWEMAINLIALGIRPENLFIQSYVPEHAELAWILGCLCSYGELQRMTQFKDKTDLIKITDSTAFVSTGLFTYPVLQAADILIYRADFVPIGKDQVQHLELTRNIAERFNHQFDTDYLRLPQPLLTSTPRIASPADPTKKMSKSLGDKHYVNVFGTEASIRKQIKSAVTDSGDTPAGEMSLGIESLFTLLKAADEEDAYNSLMADYQNNALRYGDLKAAVADALVALALPFAERKAELLADRKNVEERVQSSSAAIRSLAAEHLNAIKELVGL